MINPSSISIFKCFAISKTESRVIPSKFEHDKEGVLSRPFDKRNIFWEQYYKEVKKYSIEHKNSLIPEKYISNNLEVGKWVSRQRKFYKEKRNSLNKERIKKLY